MRSAIGRPVAAGSTATWDDFDDDGDAEPEMYHVDRDGCADPVMSRSQGEVGTDAGLVKPQRQRRPVQGYAFGSDRRIGSLFSGSAVSAGVNGDGVIDFAVPQRHGGPHGRPRTVDDFGTMVTLVNTTSRRPVRYG